MAEKTVFQLKAEAFAECAHAYYAMEGLSAEQAIEMAYKMSAGNNLDSAQCAKGEKIFRQMIKWE